MRLAQEKRQSSRTGARLRGTARFVSAVAIAATGLGALAATGPARATTSPSAAASNEWRAAYITHGPGGAMSIEAGLQVVIGCARGRPSAKSVG